MSTEYRWEWTLPTGEKVAAVVDEQKQLESVYVDGAFVSTAPRGSKPQGHELGSPKGVVVTFQKGALICILRVDNEEVAPAVWPVKKRGERPKPKIVALPIRLIATLAGVAVVGGAMLWALRTWLASSSPDVADAALTGVHRADNGRFVAHYPPRFIEKKTQSPPGTSALVLEDRVKASSIVIVARGTDVPHDAWLVHKSLQGEALTALPRGGGQWEELGRADETCVGQPGAVVRGRVKNKDGAPADVWSCAFVNDDAGYLAMYSAPSDATTEDVKALRDVVESTELTHLAELGGGL